jgi:hypothetical protein
MNPKPMTMSQNVVAPALSSTVTDWAALNILSRAKQIEIIAVDQSAYKAASLPTERSKFAWGAGEQQAAGSRLFRDHGNGSWRGQGPTGTCAGRWEAERRQ